MLNSLKKTTLSASLCGSLVILCAAGLHPETHQPSAMQEKTKPSPMHAWLKKRVGTWNVVDKRRATSTDAWVESRGIETCTIGCGGFWAFSTYTSKGTQKPYEIRTQLGYDTFKQTFIGTWVDSRGDYATMSGDLDKDQRIITLRDRIVMASAGENRVARTVLTLESKDKITIKSYVPDAVGREFLSLDRVATRVK